MQIISWHPSPTHRKQISSTSLSTSSMRWRTKTRTRLPWCGSQKTERPITASLSKRWRNTPRWQQTTSRASASSTATVSCSSWSVTTSSGSRSSHFTRSVRSRSRPRISWKSTTSTTASSPQAYPQSSSPVTAIPHSRHRKLQRTLAWTSRSSWQTARMTKQV